MKSMIKLQPKLLIAKTLHARVPALTADIDQALEDVINGQLKDHYSNGKEVMNKLLELKPDAFGGLADSTTDEPDTNTFDGGARLAAERVPDSHVMCVVCALFQ